MERKKILLLGDSLTEFFDWQGRFPNHEVRNFGIAGETVQGLRSRLARVIGMYPEADLVFLMTGINNIAMEDRAFLGPYREVVAALIKRYGRDRTFVQSLLPVLLDWVPLSAIEGLNDSLHSIARDEGAAYLDIYSHFVDAKGRPIAAYLLDDGVHVSRRGYAVWSALLASLIEG
jgi:lysophospholipase L1-like esterase